MSGVPARPKLVTVLADLSPDEVRTVMAMTPPDAKLGVARHFPNWAHDGQGEPPGVWQTWVMVAGRGFGKTRAGAEWIAARARADGQARIALVAATLDEARRVMVEGKSGLIAVAGEDIAIWSPNARLVRFRSGAEATLFSGLSPEGLRGPEHSLAWCDELAKWAKPQETWDMLQLGLRLDPSTSSGEAPSTGSGPRVLVTTTPRPGPVLKAIMKAPGCVETRGRTWANPHLSRAFLQTVEGLYAGTRLGRQELEGELLSDLPGALLTEAVLERCRVGPHPGADAPVPLPLRERESAPSPSRGEGRLAGGERGEGFIRTVIGVDPPAGDGTCGIVACALDAAGIGYVLADHSVTARSPEGWAQAVCDAAALHGADRVVVEINQGGTMVEAVLRHADPGLPVKTVRAHEGKARRAEPVTLKFEAGRVRLCGRFPELEAELCGLIQGGGYDGPGKSPDRADACVWALSELMPAKAKAEPRIRQL